jgi:hypothetical protein
VHKLSGGSTVSLPRLQACDGCDRMTVHLTQLCLTKLSTTSSLAKNTAASVVFLESRGFLHTGLRRHGPAPSAVEAAQADEVQRRLQRGQSLLGADPADQLPEVAPT